MRKTKLGVGILLAFAALTVGAAAAQAATSRPPAIRRSSPAEPSAAGTPTFTFESAQTAKCTTTGFAA